MAKTAFVGLHGLIYAKSLTNSVYPKSKTANNIPLYDTQTVINWLLRTKKKG